MLRLVVAMPLRPLSTGAGFPLATWPLHITTAPPFVTDAGLDSVVAAITPILAIQNVLQVRAGQDEGFGHSMKIPVTVIEPTAELSRLHEALVTALLGLGVVFDDPEFIGAGYRAHVTITRIDRVGPGEVLQLRQAAIVDMAPRGDQRLRVVVWTRSLPG